MSEKLMDKIQLDLILHMMMHMFLVIQDKHIIHNHQDKEVHMEVHILKQPQRVCTHMQHQLHMIVIQLDHNTQDIIRLQACNIHLVDKVGMQDHMDMEALMDIQDLMDIQELMDTQDLMDTQGMEAQLIECTNEILII